MLVLIHHKPALAELPRQHNRPYFFPIISKNLNKAWKQPGALVIRELSACFDSAALQPKTYYLAMDMTVTLYRALFSFCNYSKRFYQSLRTLLAYCSALAICNQNLRAVSTPPLE